MGPTNLLSGRLQQAACVRKSAKPGSYNRVILLADGQANCGIDQRPMDMNYRIDTHCNDAMLRGILKRKSPHCLADQILAVADGEVSFCACALIHP
jgi:hypothetical protein